MPTSKIRMVDSLDTCRFFVFIQNYVIKYIFEKHPWRYLDDINKYFTVWIMLHSVNNVTVWVMIHQKKDSFLSTTTDQILFVNSVDGSSR